MVKIVILKNPFNTHKKEIYETDYIAIQNLKTYLDKYFEYDNDFKVSVNGVLIEEPLENYYLADNDLVVACAVVQGGGDGKNIFGMIAAVALSVFSMGIGSLVSGGALFGAGALAMTSWTFAGWLAAAACLYVGGVLMNNATSSVDIDTSADFETSATYSWEGAQTHASQGTPIPMTFGKVKVTNNNVLAAHITSNGEDQYLNLIVSGGEGTIDTITDIRIDDNPISNYNDVQYEIKYGTNEQTPVSIPSFADQYSDQSLNYELEVGVWQTQLINGNSYSGAEILIELPNGLYYANDEGELSSTGLHIKAEYREENGTWQTFAGDYIADNVNTAVRRTYRRDDLEIGKTYEIRVQCTSKDDTGPRYGNRVYWTQVSGIVSDKYSYPNIALIAIKALATSQLSGTAPQITWLQERKYIYAYNPHTQQYEAKPATNAAWACYDILHLCRRLKNIHSGAYEYVVKGCPAELIMYDDFKNWADACDARGLVCNFFLDAQRSLENAFSEFEAAGRGKVVRRGTKYGCVYDRASTAVQIFGMGNILSGTFSEEFLPVSDRANAVEISFNNEKMNYERDTLVVYDDDYDENDTATSPTQITLNAVTDPVRVYKEGKYYLRRNKYLIRTVTFDADVDAISCEVGDVVLVSHDLPEWSKSGRIEAVNNGKIKLDQEIVIEAGQTYRISVRLQSGEIKKQNFTAEISNVTNIFDFAGAEQFDVYTFSKQNVQQKPFTIVTMQRTSDSVITISALEYVEAVYTENDNVPDIEYVDTEDEAGIYGLSLSLVNNTVRCSWRSNIQVMQYKIQYSRDNKIWHTAGYTPNLNYDIDTITHCGVYSIKISAATSYGKSYQATDIITINSISLMSSTPDDITGLTASIINDNIELKWDECLQDLNKSQFRGYAVYVGTDDYLKLLDVVSVNNYVWNPTMLEKDIPDNYWGYDNKGNIVWDTNTPSLDIWKLDENGDIVISESDNDTKYTLISNIIAEENIMRSYIGSDGTYTFYVARMNMDGKRSSNYAKVTMCYEEGIFPDTPTNFTIIKTKDGLKASWDPVRSDFYELRVNTDKGNVSGLVAKTSDNKIILEATSRRGTIYLYAHNRKGNYSDAAVCTYEFEELEAPALNNVDIAVNDQTVTVECVIPSYVTGYHVEFVYSSKIYEFYSEKPKLTVSLSSGIYSINISYYDVFGPGAVLEYPADITVKPAFDIAYIEDGSLSIEKMDETVSRAIQEAGDKAEEIIVNLAKSPSETGYSAIAQLNDAVNLRVEKDDVINQINLTAQGTTIDGKYLHVTGATLFDNDVISNGMIAANAVTADKLSASTMTLSSGQGIKGGAVLLNSGGLTCTASDGSKVTFNSSGMSMISAAGSLIGNIGRVVCGVVKDGQRVTFGETWSKPPVVLISPNSWLSTYSQYYSSNLTTVCSATNVSTTGFTALCRTVLNAGASGVLLSGATAATVSFKGSMSSVSSITRTYNVPNIPSTATSATMSLFLYADAKNGSRFSYGTTQSACQKHWMTVYILVNGSSVASCSCGSDPGMVAVALGTSSSESKTWSPSISFSAGATITIQTVVYCRGNEDTSFNISTPSSYVTIQSLSTSTSSDTVVGTGTASFIAIENQTTTWY